MYDVRIFNATLDKSYINHVAFPNCTEIVGPTPNVRMIALTSGEVLFELSDILYAITEYTNARFGGNNIHIRNIIKTTHGYGMVVIFRRGGYYGTIQAAKSIVNQFFDTQSSVECAAYRRISRPAVLLSIKECPTHYLADLPIPTDSRVNTSALERIVPSTLEVNAKGVFGAPWGLDQVADIPPNIADKDKDKDTPAQPQSADTADPVVAIPAMPVTTTAASVTDSLSTLIQQLAGGLKLTITVALTK